MNEKKKEFQPRQYQLELLDYVSERNGIIYLPTGAGKTFIAILALKRFSSQLQKTIENGGKRAIFMCNTVELARQQYAALKNLTNLMVGLYIGDRDVDNWARRKWENEIKVNQVLVGTAQIFVDIVNQSLIKITDLSIVIIDECHHATGNHPMHAFLSSFQYCDKNKLPRVIGLTGVIIKGNKFGQVIEELKKLEATFRGNIVTISDTEKLKNVMVYSTKPVEEMVTYSSYSHNFRVTNEVLSILQNCKSVIDNFDIGNVAQKMSKNLAKLREPNKKNAIKNLLNDFEYQMADFGLYAASVAIMSPIIEFEVKKRQAETLALKNLYRLAVQCCERVRHIIVNEMKSFLDDEDDDAGNKNNNKCRSIEVIQNFSTPKLLSLFSHLKNRFSGKKADDIACLLFVDRRYTAKCLFYVLKDYFSLVPQLQNVLRPQFMVGRQSVLYSIESILDTKWNTKAIDEFRTKQCNLIICSNVLEEGIDVQACNYVIAFDPLKTFNSYIQTKGRARSHNSYYTIFAKETEKMATLQKIQTYLKTHEEIKEFLKTRTLNRDDPTQEEIAKQFLEIIPPYVVPSGARLIASSALTLLHRYCQTLPWDNFGVSQIWFTKLPPINGKLAVALRLPLQSSVRETITPVEEMVTYSSYSHNFRVTNEVLSILQNCKSVIDNFDIGNVAQKMSKNLAKLREPNKKNAIKNLLNDFEYQMADFGLYAASVAIMSPIIEFEVKKRQAETLALKNLYRLAVQCCERVRHIIVNEMKSFLDDEDDDAGNKNNNKCRSIEVIQNFSTPKLLSLFSHLKNRFSGKKADDIACLLFVDRRYTAKCLFYVLKDYFSLVPQLQNVLRPQFMVGRQSVLYSIESILDTKWNTKAIDEFRTKQCNLIICSNVLEEGIDVQACNYVIAFDPLKTFNSYIQTKGRARSHNSYYTIFAKETEKMATLQKIQTYLKTHEEIKEFLKTRTLNRDDPTQEEIAKQFLEIIPPYVVPSGARLIASSALTLLHRYCQTLPWDNFGVSQIWFTKLPPINGKLAVALRLPLQSSVRETITSDYYATAKEAKISAAFKACVKLYENGELNKMLQPITKSECIANLSNDLFKHWKKYNDDITKQLIGKQFKRLYERKCPDELNNSLPRLGQKAYAYSIKFSTEFEMNSYNEYIIKYLGQKTTYAILLNKKLPKLAKMPLFMSQGKLHVEISDKPVECIISNAEQLNQLIQFHTMIFRDLLHVWKEFLVMDRRNEENSFLIVPIDEIPSINWQLVKEFQHLNPCRSYNLTERQNTKYRPEDYLNKVVTKWYNDLQSESFVVTKVREDLTPMSSFDTKQYDTYADFYSSRYDIPIVQKQQFLLEVKCLTHRRNFFNNASNKSADKKKDIAKVILVPELCHNYKYPADLWLKALFLPTILHRVYYMLHAESLRIRINKYLNLEQYFTNYSPKPLIVDLSLKRALDDDGNLVKEKEHPKKVLLSLPTKKQSHNYQVHPLDQDDVTWKSYLEPVDLLRSMDQTYPVELDYYYKFIMNLIPEVEKLKLNDEMEYSKSQFDMPTISSAIAGAESISGHMGQLAIKGPTVAENIQIEMLKRNQEPDYLLKSAEQFEFLAAITAARVNDVFDMERFELLGDAFLKFSASIYLANKFSSWHEGFLTIVKGRMVSNRNLLYCMMNTNLCQRICATLFNPNADWLPPLASLPANLLEILKTNLPDASILSPSDFYSLQLTDEEIFSGECTADKLDRFVQACNKSKELLAGNTEIDPDNEMNIFINKYVLRDKVVADTLEALLGVCVKNYGLHRSFQMLEFFGICTSDNKKEFNLLDLKLSSGNLRTNISEMEVDSFLINHECLEKNLGYTFRDRAFLLQALTHPSYPTNRLTGCYQELEFIGDAILDILITCYIFERHQDMNPGKMTDLRMALVNNITLGCVCVRHKFHLCLLYENSALAEAIKAFTDFQKSQNYRVTDQVRILMEEENDTINPFNDVLNYSNSEEDINENDDDMEAIEDNKTAWPGDKKSYNLSKNVDVPKALGDIVEALIAAVYLDCRDLNITWKVIYNLMKIELEEFSINIPIDPVRQLEENKQAKPRYSPPITDNTDVMVQCKFNCLDNTFTTNGFGCNARQAKKAAAKQALQILAKHSN